MDDPILNNLRDMPSSRLSDRKPVIIGHRGALAVAPENTIPAFEAALDGGADGVEFDVQRTVDGHLVVFHDEDIARTTGENGKMPQMTLNELQRLDVGSHFDERFRGTRIPTLTEFFDWARGNDLLLFLELKEPYRFPGIEQEVVKLIRAHDLVDRLQVRSFYHANLLQLHQIAPEVAISELWLNHVPWQAEIVYSTLNLQYGLINEDHIKQIHDLGRKVSAWVVDDLDDARRLKDWGIDGITTNDPAFIARIFD